jgi:hypothetical protein
MRVSESRKTVKQNKIYASPPKEVLLTRAKINGKNFAGVFVFIAKLLDQLILGLENRVTTKFYQSFHKATSIFECIPNYTHRAPMLSLARLYSNLSELLAAH